MTLSNIYYYFKNIYFQIILDGVSYARKSGVKVGNECRILTNKFGSEPWLISIGNKVTITNGVTFLTHDGAAWLINDEKGRRYSFRKILIGSNVFVGVNTIIMPGVIIEDNVIVAAGSVVTKSISSGKIVGGNPAKIIGDFDEYRKKSLANFVSDSEMNYNIPYVDRVNNILDNSFKEYYQS